MKPTSTIWKNGKLIKWEDATTHVLSHGLHYGTGVFEGVRAYDTPKGPAIFRSNEHYKRLVNSAKLIYMDSPYTANELIQATKELIKSNQLTSCYIRPLLYYGYGEMGLNPGKNTVDTVIAAWEWGTYLGEEGLKSGITCKISSWNRIDSRIIPPLAKSTANYLNSALAKMEAIRCGYDEAILLNINGNIAEGPGENLFLVKDNCVYTVPVTDNALHGITSQSVIQIAKDLGYAFSFKSLIRDELFLADELFFTGTAAEVTPIREIDGITIGEGKRGPVTQKLQQAFFDAVKGKDARYSHWLDLVK